MHGMDPPRPPDTPPAHRAGPGTPGGPRPPPRVDWAAALARHGRWLRQVILCRLGERQAVEEVMQEVSLAAAAAPHDGTVGSAQVAPWLYRVTVRQVLVYRRKSGRRRKLMDGVARRATSGQSSGQA